MGEYKVGDLVKVLETNIDILLDNYECRWVDIGTVVITKVKEKN